MTQLQPKQEEEILQEINSCHDKYVFVQPPLYMHSAVFLLQSCTYRVENSVDPDQMASSESICSKSAYCFQKWINPDSAGLGGMCHQQSLRSACAYMQSDQSLC